jgi:hypothetical protein
VTTLSEMIDETLINLSGYTYQQDRSTHLTAAVTTLTSPSSSPTILSLGSTDSVGKGIIEVGEELMWVDSFDRVANTATIAPYGRGYLGTDASTAALDTKVTISPIFPRYVVKRAINDTIRAMGTQLLVIDQTTFTYNAAITTYELTDSNGDPLDIQNILTMSWQDIGPSKEWINVRQLWTFDPKAEAATWDAGAQTVTIGDYITPGRTVKVNYIKQPSAFTASNEVFTTQTGYPESARDVVILGAAYRLLTYLDPARASQISPQADEIDAKRPFGSANTAVRQIFSLYQQRLREEILAFQGQYPARVHYSR